GDMKLFIESLSKLAPKTRNNCISGVRELFNFAKRQKYLPKDFDQLEGIELFEDNGGEVVVWKPEEMQAILQNAGGCVIPALTICAFAGVRTEELYRLDWSEVDLRRKFIEITKAKAKTKRRRLIPIQKNLISWLLPYSKREGPVLEVSEEEFLAE